MKVSWKALLVGLSLATSVLAAPAVMARIVVDVDVPPPPLRVEAVPAPRVGFVWAPGFWDWRGGQHVWVGAHWIAERRGYHWVPDRWERGGPHWHRSEGHWER